MMLGALRNLSVAEARGDVVCQWDDDDLHHPDRIAMQLSALESSDASATILQDVLAAPRRREYAALDQLGTDPPRAGTPQHCSAAVTRGLAYPEQGPEAIRGEDLAAVLSFATADRLHRQANAPHLYAYVTHGSNTCKPAHHDRLAGYACDLAQPAAPARGTDPFGGGHSGSGWSGVHRAGGSRLHAVRMRITSVYSGLPSSAATKRLSMPSGIGAVSRRIGPSTATPDDPMTSLGKVCVFIR